jgi:outer membrane protein OmpA-like peptidoglycan-associated protein
MSKTAVSDTPSGLGHPWITWVLIMLLGACSAPPQMMPSSSSATAATPPSPPPSPPPVLPFDEAVMKAANDLFAKAQLPAAGTSSPVRRALVIDPLVDGLTGVQSTATQSMQSLIEQVARDKYPQFEVQPFSASNVATSPIVLVGTFTGVNKEGKTEGTRQAYRICLALADLKSGKIVGKARAFAQMQGVDATPMRYFQDSPPWTQDPATEAYIKTCQGTKLGDPIDSIYVDRIIAAALINDAMNAYNTGRYRESLDLYTNALQTTGGDQLRVYNGVYLANWKLGQRNAAAQAFAKIVDYGLANKRLAVKFLFKPGSTAFWPDPQVSEPYAGWLQQIAAGTSKHNACLEITGHTSPTGPEPLNERLSLLRAEYIKQRLESDAPELGKRTIADGKGSRENMVGTGRDDATDALDRRVEFKVLEC